MALHARAAAVGTRVGYAGRMTKLLSVPPARLKPSPDNPRHALGDLTELSKSLLAQGLIEPIIARELDDGSLEIVAGHRRARAATLAGLKTVDVVVRPLARQEALEVALTENTERESLDAMETARGYQRLAEMGKLTGRQVAERLGLPVSTVHASMVLLKLPEEVQKAIGQGRFSAEAGRSISSVDGERLQLAAFHEALKLTKPGEKMPSSRAVIRMVQAKYLGKAKKGQSKHQREAKELGDEVALRRRVVLRLLARVGELIERKPHYDETDLRLMATARAENGSDVAREVFQRHGVHPGRPGKVGGSQLRKLVMELDLAQWVALEGAEYSTGARVVAKAYGLSLSELERNVAAEVNAEALFKPKG